MEVEIVGLMEVDIRVNGGRDSSVNGGIDSRVNGGRY